MQTVAVPLLVPKSDDKILRWVCRNLSCCICRNHTNDTGRFSGGARKIAHNDVRAQTSDVRGGDNSIGSGRKIGSNRQRPISSTVVGNGGHVVAFVDRGCDAPRAPKLCSTRMELLAT